MEDGMNVAFLSLGGNMGNRLEILEQTVAQIEKRCGPVLKKSSVYETDAWGSASGRKNLNQVIKINTRHSPVRLLKELLVIEKEGGRIRTNERNSDRKIDIDILFYNQERIRRGNLHIPHPRLHLRNFVLVPFHEIEKDFVHPHLKKNIATLLKKTTDTLGVRPIRSKSKPMFICLEGNIGSGKTTLARELVKRMGAHYLPEQFEEIGLLPLFYKHPRKYAFSVEFSFLLNRFKQLSTTDLTGQNVVSDFCIHKSLWFAKTNLRPSEYRIFKKHFVALAENVSAPDLVIYLKTSLPNLQQNIRERGRIFEQNISPKYLGALDKAYHKGLKRLPNTKILEIGIQRYNAKTTQSAIKKIEKYIFENFG
jgi:deoxyguanosine kinase